MSLVISSHYIFCYTKEIRRNITGIITKKAPAAILLWSTITGIPAKAAFENMTEAILASFSFG